MFVGKHSDQTGCKVMLYTLERMLDEGTEHSLDAYETLSVEEPACDSISDCQEFLLLVSRDMAARSEAGVVDSPQRLHPHLLKRRHTLPIQQHGLRPGDPGVF